MFAGLKAFLLRGDVLTLAVAVIIGGAFQNIINSMVNDLITPILGMLTGGVEFSKSLIFGGKANAEGVVEGGFRLGSFIQAIINFLMIGTVLYMLIKAAGKDSAEVK
jgi:large conductance mechanosensitive channel